MLKKLKKTETDEKIAYPTRHVAACGVQKTELPLLPEEAFQTTVDGKPVALYTLHAGDITMQVTNYGARVVSL